ncbi:hypothetical protein SAMD00019534_064810 [Acytostelium subglobosum LB1]|uniref:hypothetical protein n=1 Tax=Acytostelium subglobosum LB1 TaxID=1410327 RepID=UPI0006449EE1|nr:hypothetical protein SAMD00019534_064810 [Acytostelium subglobosum LB1]GAM23306.1 hypothetical protein SAMD00019534_064810 [Acytostelium subglobosum LB1]|eukprot:XP_012753755.1 hypothetical protein SAMD00019534_064810 [Acytostelium subglobosum LB1]
MSLPYLTSSECLRHLYIPLDYPSKISKMKLILSCLLLALVSINIAASDPSARDYLAASLVGSAPPVTNISSAHRDITVGIVGAGMAGLYAGLIFDELGIDFEIIEASPRIGGRVMTHYFSDNENDYVDLGAMRFPKTGVMERVIGQSSWSLVSKLRALGNPVTTAPYYLSHKNNPVYFNGIRNYGDTPMINDPLHVGDQYNGGVGSGVPDCFAAKPPTYWVGKVIGKFIYAMTMNFDQGYKMLLQQDCLSVRYYMANVFKDGECQPNGTLASYPQPLITYLETQLVGTGWFDFNSITEAVLNFLDFTAAEYYHIEGGTHSFVDAILDSIGRSSVETRKRVNRIAPGAPRGTGVNARPTVSVQVEGERRTRNYDHVISTVALGVLERIDTGDLNLSFKKREAIRSLTYDHSVKVAMSFRSRWWEDPIVMNGRPIYGGQSSTDLPIRQVNYPSYGINDTRSYANGILVGYTWGQDGIRLSGLTNDKKQLEQLLLQNLAELHQVDVEYLDRQLLDWKIWNWDDYQYQSGSFAGFSPCQFSLYFPEMIKSEANGTVHFAGEATSVHHAWILGALNSAYRTVDQVLVTEGWNDLRQQLRTSWGTVNEWQSEGLPPFTPATTVASIQGAEPVIDAKRI